MRRLCLLAVALCLSLLAGLGCAGPGKDSVWNDAWKDLRGDNMQMGSHKSNIP